jgi:signal transduction histidine kinase
VTAALAMQCRRWGTGVASWWGWLSRREDVARACHELRGSITAARLGLEPPAGSDHLGISPARLRAVELELEKAALALEDLTETTAARRTASMTSGWVELPGVLLDSVEAWRAIAEDQGVELRLRWSGPPLSIRGDRLRLAQAAGNLIGNAIEHGGGLVEVRARPERAGVRIEVIDGGAGLTAPLDQLTSCARGGRGARGRGLAIAAAIATAHGGRLGVAPSDRGARLVLELPAVGAAGARSHRRPDLQA